MAFYAVRKGRQPGIYLSWDECKAQTHGFSGAVYKKFESRDDALAFLDGDKNSCNAETIEEMFNVEDPESVCVAYVDGSFNESSSEYGYGIVLILSDGTIDTLCGHGNREDAVSMRNVMGEIKASMMAVNMAVALEMKSIVICHDYTGICEWAAGNWAAKLPLTQEYQKFMKEAAKQIDIRFKKIAAHTGEKYNEMADTLAKKGCHLI